MTDAPQTKAGSAETPDQRTARLSEGLDYVKDLPGFKRGHPHYFKNPMIDHLLEIVLQLGGEVWVSRDRQMVMEYLLATEGKVTPEMIEQFKPTPEFAAKLKSDRLTFTRRVYQCLTEGLPERDDPQFLSGVVKD